MCVCVGEVAHVCLAPSLSLCLSLSRARALSPHLSVPLSLAAFPFSPSATLPVPLSHSLILSHPPLSACLSPGAEPEMDWGVTRCTFLSAACSILAGICVGGRYFLSLSHTLSLSLFLCSSFVEHIRPLNTHTHTPARLREGGREGQRERERETASQREKERARGRHRERYLHSYVCACMDVCVCAWL